MKYLTENDFSTDVEDETYEVIMDDNNRIITYGHLEDSEIEELAGAYLLATGETDLSDWFDGHHTVTHQWATLEQESVYGERIFKLLKPGDDIDEFAAPITILHF